MTKRTTTPKKAPFKFTPPPIPVRPDHQQISHMRARIERIVEEKRLEREARARWEAMTEEQHKAKLFNDLLFKKK